MQYIYAALLLHKAGKEINEENMKKVMQAIGIESDESGIKTVVASLKGVDIDKELSESAILTASASATEKPKAEEKKEEKHEEAAEGLAALFG